MIQDQSLEEFNNATSSDNDNVTQNLNTKDQPDVYDPLKVCIDGNAISNSSEWNNDSLVNEFKETISEHKKDFNTESTDETELEKSSTSSDLYDPTKEIPVSLEKILETSIEASLHDENEPIDSLKQKANLEQVPDTISELQQDLHTKSTCETVEIEQCVANSDSYNMTREIPVSNNLEKVTEPLIETPLDVVHNESTNTIDLLKKEAINETNDDIEEETCLEEGSVAPPSGEELFFIDVEPQEQYKVQLNTPEEELKKLPVGSKLFVGNLPVDYNDEDELVSIFSLYGNIYGISFVHKPRMTQAYIQFDQPASVKMSIEKEDRKVMKQDLQDELERNKPQAPPIPPNEKKKSNTAEKKRRRESTDRKKDRTRNQNRGRDREARSGRYDYRDYSPIRRRGYIPLAQVLVLGDVETRFVDRVESRCRNMMVSTHFATISPHNIARYVQDCKRDGVIGIIFLERSRERSGFVAVQIFSSRGVLEYDNLSVEESCRYILRERDARNQSNMPPTMPPNLAAIMSTLTSQQLGQNVSIDPAILLHLAAIASNGGTVPTPNMGSFPQLPLSVPQPMPSLPMMNSFPTQDAYNPIQQSNTIQSSNAVENAYNPISQFSKPNNQPEPSQIAQMLNQLNQNASLLESMRRK